MARRADDPLLSPSVFIANAFHGGHNPKLPKRFMPTDLEKLAQIRNMEKNEHQKLSIGERIREMFHSQFAYDASEENSWSFGYLLGYGSFGLAAMYRQLGSDGELKKKLVLKSEQFRKDLAVNRNRDDISQEAFHHAMINKRTEREFANVFLHSYRYHTGLRLTIRDAKWKDPIEEWRYYLEFCQRGTLEEIHMKYKAWGYHLPETFIWWVFYWLVRSCKTLDVNGEKPFLGPGPAAFMGRLPRSYMLHNDLAWRNVFFQHETLNFRDRILWDRYPGARVADFGLSQVVPEDGHDNAKAMYIKPGTPWFASPEKRKMETSTDFYPFSPTAEDHRFAHPTVIPPIKYMHNVTPSSNLWGVAYLVYLLMTLEDPDDTHDFLETILTKGTYYGEQSKWTQGMDGRRISGGLFTFSEIDTNLPHENFAPYSDTLQQLVLDCTRLQPHKRPSLAEVEERVRAGMHEESERLHEEFGDDQNAFLRATRVVFDVDEWNKIPHGPFNFVDLTPGEVPDKSLQQFWADFHERFNGGLRNPDDDFLIPPGSNVAYIHQGDIFEDVLQMHSNPEIKDGVCYLREQWFPNLHRTRDPLPLGGRPMNSWSAEVQTSTSESEMELEPQPEPEQEQMQQSFYQHVQNPDHMHYEDQMEYPNQMQYPMRYQDHVQYQQYMQPPQRAQQQRQFQDTMQDQELDSDSDGGTMFI